LSEGAPDSSADRAPSKSALREWLEAVGLALLLAVLVRSLVVQAFKIPSASMMPTLQIGDHLLIDKLRYGIRNPLWNGWLVRYARPRPGDVVVFAYPVDPTKDFIKRVVAVEGEEVEIRDKHSWSTAPARIRGVLRRQPGRRGPRRRATVRPLKVAKGRSSCWSNRDRSYDSRFWGFVDRRREGRP
jgi:signal peptidase I